MRIIMWIIMIFGGGALGYYLDNVLFNNLHLGIVFHIVSFIIGLFLLSVMIRISKNTGRTLAKYGRKGKLKRMQTNVMVNNGVYKYMRHPMHLGLFLFPIAAAFLIGSPSFILIIAPVEICIMLILIKFIEEPQTVKKFGNEYINYKKQTPWFCFKIKCINELLASTAKT